MGDFLQCPSCKGDFLQYPLVGWQLTLIRHVCARGAIYTVIQEDRGRQ